MFYLKLFQLLTIVLALVTFVTQVLVPMYKGTKMWPFFNKRRSKVLHDITNVQEDIEIKNLDARLESLKKSTNPSKGDNNG
jgi:hypothetical protein